MSNRIGHSLNITSFGESHGNMVGVVIDGFPAAFPIDLDYIQSELNRRRPGQSDITSARNERDEFTIVSGVFDGLSTGAPICIQIPNEAQISKDYEHLKNVYRPGHADQVYDEKYGHRDYLGGGRSSARITAAWVAAGALFKSYLLQKAGITIQAVVSSVGDISVQNVFELDWSAAEHNPVRCPNQNTAKEIQELIKQTADEGDSLGGIISCKVSNCQSGLGEPVFDKLNAELAKAIFSINAVKGIEFGSGFKSSKHKGSENNDAPNRSMNNDGGITAGISNGKDILFNTAFKPVSSIAKEQMAMNTNGEIIPLQIKGRHDPCVLPRAVPIVEAMTALVICDHLLLNLKYKK
jgi:chorismate synthase